MRKKDNVRAGERQTIHRYSGLIACGDCGRAFIGKRINQIIRFIEGIDVFCCGQHPNSVLPQVIDIQGSLCAVPSKAGQVFHDDCIDQSGIRIIINENRR